MNTVDLSNKDEVFSKLLQNDAFANIIKLIETMNSNEEKLNEAVKAFQEKGDSSNIKYFAKKRVLITVDFGGDYCWSYITGLGWVECKAVDVALEA